ncbi:MAG TPA: hypothetical protein VLJ60_09875 [bacterium]|nr:hypothetical protein [bacterium]
MRNALIFLMVLTVLNLFADEPASPYDIPDRREMDACSCAQDVDSFVDQLDEPFFITVTIANFGKEVLTNVNISTNPGVSCVIYLAETSEISKRKNFSENHKWEKVPDNFSQENKIVEIIFPFTENFHIADTLAPCENESSNCENIMIRYQHHVYGGCPKTYEARFQATIVDDTGKPYKTNSAYPLKLRQGYSTNPDCYIAPQDQCGGHSFTRPEEITDEDESNDADMLENSDSDTKKSDGCSVLIF